MKFDAIVYTSKAGHTKRYAEMLGQITGKPVLTREDALSSLPAGSRIVYMGWLHASHIKGYPQAAERFQIPIVCGVGLCDTGTLLDEVRKATPIPDDVRLFTLQGSIDRSRLKGLDKLLISMLTKGLESKKDRSEQDERMLELLKSDADLVRSANLKELLTVLEA